MDNKKPPQQNNPSQPQGNAAPPSSPSDTQNSSTPNTPPPPSKGSTQPSTPPSTTSSPNLQSPKNTPQFTQQPQKPTQPQNPKMGSSGTPPPSGTPPQNGQNQQDHPKKSLPKWLLAVLTLLVIALLGVGAYAAYTNFVSPQPTPTPSPTTTPPTPTQAPPNNQSILSEDLNVSFSVPFEWTHTSDITPEDITTDYGSGVTTPNEYVTSNQGCALYVGEVAGSGGPTQVLTNETITIDEGSFNKRSWYRESTDEAPFFMYISSESPTENDYPSIWAWIPEDENAQNCLDNIDQTLSSFTFIEPASILPITPSEDATPPGEVTQCTLDAKVCPDGSTVGRQGPNCEFAPCPGE